MIWTIDCKDLGIGFHFRKLIIVEERPKDNLLKNGLTSNILFFLRPADII